MNIYATAAQSTQVEVTWPIQSTEVTVGGETRENAFYGNAENKYKRIHRASTYFHDIPFIAPASNTNYLKCDTEIISFPRTLLFC
jgi:hypothetical protein